MHQVQDRIAYQNFSLILPLSNTAALWFLSIVSGPVKYLRTVFYNLGELTSICFCGALIVGRRSGLRWWQPSHRNHLHCEVLHTCLHRDVERQPRGRHVQRK